MKAAARVRIQKLARWLKQNRSAAGKGLISCWIIFYFVFALIHQLPEHALVTKLKEPTRTLAEYFGWVQNWHLFGPNLRTTNFHSFALIGYADGTIGSWEPPRFDLLTLHQRFCKDKFHKWDQDCIPWSNYRDFWPDLARYVGRLHWDPHNPPVWFMLLRYEADIPDPTTGVILAHDNMPPHTKLFNAFTYHFRPEDFR